MMYAQTPSLLTLQNEISAHLEEICKLFKQRPKITIVIRTPWLEAEGKDGGILLTDDDFDAAIAEINRLRNRPTIGKAKAEEGFRSDSKGNG